MSLGGSGRVIVVFGRVGSAIFAGCLTGFGVSTFGWIFGGVLTISSFTCCLGCTGFSGFCRIARYRPAAPPIRITIIPLIIQSTMSPPLSADMLPACPASAGSSFSCTGGAAVGSEASSPDVGICSGGVVSYFGASNCCGVSCASSVLTVQCLASLISCPFVNAVNGFSHHCLVFEYSDEVSPQHVSSLFSPPSSNSLLVQHAATYFIFGEPPPLLGGGGAFTVYSHVVSPSFGGIAESIPLIVDAKLPAVVSVPVIVQLNGSRMLRISPGGRLPRITEHDTTGGTHPSPTSVNVSITESPTSNVPPTHGVKTQGPAPLYIVK